LNYVHCVFSTKGRAQLIRDPEPLWAYMRGIARNCGFEIIEIGGTSNHVHVLLSLPAGMHLVDNVSRPQSEFIAVHEGHGAALRLAGWLCWNQRQPLTTRKREEYIARQEEHHRKRTFDDEFLALLNHAGVGYDPKYVFAN